MQLAPVNNDLASKSQTTQPNERRTVTDTEYGRGVCLHDCTPCCEQPHLGGQSTMVEVERGIVQCELTLTQVDCDRKAARFV